MMTKAWLIVLTLYACIASAAQSNEWEYNEDVDGEIDEIYRMHNELIRSQEESKKSQRQTRNERNKKRLQQQQRHWI